MLFAQPGRSGLGIGHFASAHVMGAGALPDATVVEPQGHVAGVARGALQGRDHFVEHGATLDRVGVADQHRATCIGHVQVQGFQLAAGAIDEQGGFADKQGTTP
ncbi:hypothetical protein D3C75_824900 [compost metagenome]